MTKPITDRGGRPLRFTRFAAYGAILGALTLAAAGCTSSKGSSSASGSASPSGGAASSTTSSTGSTAAGLEQVYEQVVHDVLPSVVEVQTSAGLGSGVVFDDKGDIVTNHHVVGDATTFQVRFATAATAVAATLVGSYPPDDLAVIRVRNAPKLQPATFADSSKVRVGQIVLAMGNPLGLSSSVTNGIVSAVGRTVTEPADATSPGATLPNVLQTSAAINPGNSGGALVNIAGQVVGIPTLAATDPQLGGGAAPGIGFAIPSSTVKDIAGQLAASGKVTSPHRAGLGVRVVTVTGADGNPAGVGVVGVTAGGAAATAGIRAGDVITAINATPTPSTQELSGVLANLAPGDKASVSLTRSDGSTTKVTVVLGQLSGA